MGRVTAQSQTIEVIMRFHFLMPILLVFGCPAVAWATQTHGDPEGLYAHQIAHLFFIFSMGLLIYWLRRHDLVAQSGWRLIQHAALFFILWNIDAFTVHWLEEQIDLLSISQEDPFFIYLNAPAGQTWIAWTYYFAKLDHLLCVPAMVLLYLGLRRLNKSPWDQPARGKRQES